ncbi:hypothetical protein WJX72_001709 [[Myrmecia] bisecta]|uniref:Nucleoside transporter n=1 Tax=[Myrmecia] bisecta TaxID=41462 RepID=A0AAW1Q606_9CHLO
MTGAPFGNNPNPNKIKGGRWTVIRFFSVSVAFTIVWMTISSELGYYKLLYGPQVLLLMNIAYFLPSIPLLFVSSLCDGWLDRRYGVARTILARLLCGLGGCILIGMVYPFEPQSVRWLLGTVTVLGLMHGVAFSASYQMVSRFANKNTISLGLGCVGSGLIVLLLQLVLRLGPKPTRLQAKVMYEVVAGFVVLGFLASISLLLRHWNAIEAASAHKGEAAITTPLLQQEEGRSDQSSLVVAEQTTEVRHQRSISSTLINFSPLDPFATVSEGDNVFDGSIAIRGGRAELKRASTSFKDSFLQANRESRAGREPGAVSVRRTISSPSETLSVYPTLPAKGRGPVASAHTPPQSAAPGVASDQGAATRNRPPTIPEAGSPSRPATPVQPAGLQRQTSGDHGHLREVLAGIWPAMVALFLSGTVGILVFPYFTYCPSGGQFGELLPKVLFFARLFADVAGRTLPRIKRLAIRSPYLLLALGLTKACVCPVFFLYLKSGDSWHNDYLAVGYVVCLWALGGVINTNAYVVAPQCVAPQLKAGAAGLMALASQVAHCVGLGLAVLVAVLVFGGIEIA